LQWLLGKIIDFSGKRSQINPINEPKEAPRKKYKILSIPNYSKKDRKSILLASYLEIF